MKRSIAVVLLGGSISLAGCASLMGNMDAKQLEIMLKDRSSTAGCIQYTGTGGQFTSLIANNDRTFGNAGGKTTFKCGAGELIFEDSGKTATQVSPVK